MNLICAGKKGDYCKEGKKMPTQLKHLIFIQYVSMYNRMNPFEDKNCNLQLKTKIVHNLITPFISFKNLMKKVKNQKYVCYFPTNKRSKMCLGFLSRSVIVAYCKTGYFFQTTFYLRINLFSV